MSGTQERPTGQQTGGTVKFGDQSAERRPSGGPPSAGGGFDLNRPTIISLCYLGSIITGISGIVGIVLGHVWKGEGEGGSNESWMTSHYTYLIRTFWIGFAASIAATVLSVILIGFLLFPVIAVWVLVRSVMSMLKAQKQEPMPDPETLVF
ncbi:DUF4870 family protein [Erythrobacter sp. W53]|uniref:DUF4870 family protein n=1 Tax=Erythrobacter sp. W53 TaxID=3425947 RepID=UPI003D768784